jgi:hypothetical protein
MSEPGRQRVNEAVSAWFEPIIGLEAIPHENSNCPPTCNADHDTFPDISPKGMWLLRTRPFWHWAPSCDYFTDEAANARLLEAMPDALLHHTGAFSSTYAVLNSWGCKHTHDGDPSTIFWDKDRKTAIVLAFCKFAGIEVAGD